MRLYSMAVLLRATRPFSHVAITFNSAELHIPGVSLPKCPREIHGIEALTGFARSKRRESRRTAHYNSTERSDFGYKGHAWNETRR